MIFSHFKFEPLIISAHKLKSTTVMHLIMLPSEITLRLIPYSFISFFNAFIFTEIFLTHMIKNVGLFTLLLYDLKGYNPLFSSVYLLLESHRKYIKHCNIF